MAHEIAVWLFARPVGMLSLHAGRLSFRYQVDWLQHPQAAALSHSLPLQAPPFDDSRCRALFAGLLPGRDGIRLSLAGAQDKLL